MAVWNKRRAFLGAIAALSLGVGLGRWFYRPRQLDDPRIEQIAATVRRLLPYLRIEDDALARFAQDLLARDQQARLQDEAWLGQQFLLSSDFFWNGADVAKVVGYRAYYDPYELPCANPFAHWQ